MCVSVCVTINGYVWSDYAGLLCFSLHIIRFCGVSHETEGMQFIYISK